MQTLVLYLNQYINKTESAVSDQSKNPTSFIQEILKSESLNATANLSWTLLNGYGIKANQRKIKSTRIFK